MPVTANPILSLPCPDGFSPEETLFCGQCFRFERQGDTISGAAGARFLSLRHQGERLLLTHCREEDLPFWETYFDFPTDYTSLKFLFSQDETMARACAFAPGIRILRQEPWEALCSFILSQNNNIRRITGIIARLCQAFGEPIPGAPEGVCSFPSPQRLASLSPEELAPLRAGFRAKYVLDAARKVASGQVRFDFLAAAPLPQAREHLMQIYGVGPKVADCALLYGLHRLDAFPVDTWIRKALSRYYPQGFPPEFLPSRGAAQQFLFHYIRHLEKERQ